MDKKHISLEKVIGIWRTKIKADLEIEGDQVKLIKGYTEGFAGFKFNLWGQPIGFGFSDWGFWMKQEVIASKKEGINQELVTRVCASYNSIYFFINVKNVIEIGSYSLEIPSPRIRFI